jgi:magnesium chelatase family protein
MKTQAQAPVPLPPQVLSPTFEFSAPLHHEPHPSLQWIEISSTLQLPGFQIVGLPGKEVNEARERVRAAIESSGFEFPRRRIVLNLSPANIRKQGTGIDLAMALSILCEPADGSSANASVPSQTRHFRGAAWGELGLDGRIKACGQLTRTLVAAIEGKVDFIVLGPENAAQLAEAIEVISMQIPTPSLPPIGTFQYLNEALTWVSQLGWKKSEAKRPLNRPEPLAPPPHLLAEVERLLPLSSQLSRVLGIAAAGKHHLILLGARGTGKSHALEWLEQLQLPVSPQTRLQQKCLLEIATQTLLGRHQSDTKSKNTVPIRRAGQQIRPAALIGRADSQGLHPGEFTLAQGGLLIADEFLEWNRDSREAFREPLERGTITLTRAWAQVELPARFTLAATGNLCKCGGWPPALHRQLKLEHAAWAVRLPECVCLPREREEYIHKLSGPLFDRIDLVVRTPPLLPDPIANEVKKNPANHPLHQLQTLREKTQRVHAQMISKWGCPTAEIAGKQLESLLEQQPHFSKSQALQEAASLRSRHRTLRVALALALWDEPEGDGLPGPHHFREAMSYRGESLGLGGG